MSSLSADLIILLINFISASTYLVTKLSVAPGSDAVSPVTFVALRFLLASAALVIIFPGRIRQIGRPALVSGSIIGAICASGIISLTIGLQFVQTGFAAFLICLCSVMVPLLDRIMYREAIGGFVYFGLSAAVAGVYLLSGGEFHLAPGAGIILIAALFFALHTIFNSRFSQNVSALDIGIVQIIVCAVCSTAAALLLETPRLPQSINTWYALLYISLAATALRFMVQVYAQSFTTPTRAGVMFMSEPVITAFYGYYFAAEILSPPQLAGCSLILAGTLIAQAGPWLHGRRTVIETVS